MFDHQPNQYVRQVLMTLDAFLNTNVLCLLSTMHPNNNARPGLIREISMVNNVLRRDSSFQQELMHVTNQRGVDIVLNSTAGEILRQSWQCLAPLGRFVEIGKRDLVRNSNLEMGKFEEAVTFSAVDLGLLAEKRPHTFKALLNNVVDLYQHREIQAVSPITIFSISEVQQAMRMMQSGKHIGKVVIEAKSDSVVQVK